MFTHLSFQLAGTHMLIESMDVRELHSAFKVVSDLQQKIVVLIARIAQTEANKLHSPGSSNLSLRPNTSMPRKDQTTPIISSVNTSRLSLDSRKTSPRVNFLHFLPFSFLLQLCIYLFSPRKLS